MTGITEEEWSALAKNGKGKGVEDQYGRVWRVADNSGLIPIRTGDDEVRLSFQGCTYTAVWRRGQILVNKGNGNGFVAESCLNWHNVDIIDVRGG